MGLDSDNGSEATLTFGYYGDLWSLIKAYWDDVGIETEMSAMGGGAPASFAVAARLAPKPALSVRQIMLRKKVRQIPRLAPRHNGAKQQGNDSQGRAPFATGDGFQCHRLRFRLSFDPGGRPRRFP